jgi:hypothetical protein
MKFLNEALSRALTIATLGFSGFTVLQLYNPSYRGLYCMSTVKRL